MIKLLVVKHKLLLTIAALFSVAVVSNAFKPRDYHPQNTECGSCHLATEVTKQNAHQLLNSQERLCLDCHPNALQVSHPSGFVPTRNLPEIYPLDWKGDVTCSTCHEIHGSEHGLLRGKQTGRGFCMSCHDEGFFNSMADKGASIQLTGHIAAAEIPENLDLDPFSMQCLSCHSEGSEGPISRIDARGIVRHGSGSGNHPIGMSYGETRGIGLYRKISELPPGILLPEGKMACVSCHVGYSKQHGALVLSTDRSALCMGCHDV
jgi:predicted CXXCH cytochrome family protein